MMVAVLASALRRVASNQSLRRSSSSFCQGAAWRAATSSSTFQRRANPHCNLRALSQTHHHCNDEQSHRKPKIRIPSSDVQSRSDYNGPQLTTAKPAVHTVLETDDYKVDTKGQIQQYVHLTCICMAACTGLLFCCHFSLQTTALCVRMMKLAESQKTLLAGSVGLLFLTSGASLVFPAALGQILDMTMSNTEAAISLETATYGLVGLFTAHATFMALRSLLLSMAGERISVKLRTDVFDNILRQHTAFFDTHSSGELVNRLAADCGILQKTLTSSLSQGLRSVTLGLGSLGMMAYLSPELLLFSMAILPPVVGTAIILNRRIKRQQAKVQDALAAATSSAADSMTNVRLAREFGNEALESTRYRDAMEAMYQTAIAVGKSNAVLEGLVFFGVNMSLVAVLGYGGNLVLQDSLSVGNLTSFLMYSLYLGIHTSSISSVYTEFSKSLGASHRLFTLLAMPRSSTSTMPPAGAHCDFDNETANRPSSSQGMGLSLRDITFAYPTRPDAVVLNGLSMDIMPGSVVGLCGPSGCGKSSLARLLCQMYEPQAGTIMIDGQCLGSDLHSRQLRSQLAVVSQEAPLFNRTVLENIRYSRPEASIADVQEVARMANAHEFIEALPEKYNTHVGERGVTLSGGQRARVAIARALLRKPRLLVMDEASSSLDAQNEAQVHAALQHALEARHGITTLLIAHRLSTLRAADIIHVLDKGRVVESGSYDELAMNEGIFASMLTYQHGVPDEQGEIRNTI